VDKLNIENRLIGTGEPIFIIAEAGINHDGNIARAHELIESAAKAGADCIKFHTHLASDEMLNVDDTASYLNESQYQLIKRVELSFENHIELKEHAEKNNMIFLSTPFSREAVDLLEHVNVQAYKVGSGELTNLPLLEHIIARKKPLIVSTGMSSFQEVASTVDFLKDNNASFALMQCNSRYPTPPSEVHLGVISRYLQEFNVPVGLSDHSAVNYTVFAAVSLGICIVEKHFTVSRKWPGPDQTSSLEPGELNELVQGIRDIEMSLDDSKIVHQDEVALQELFRASVVTLKPITRGKVISEDMVWVKRPGYGIPASRLREVIGRKTKCDLGPNQLVSWEDIE
jgi:sialic acid synthase SpsE